MNGEQSAYPSHGSMGEVVHPGLTKRELFAAMAMQGFLSDRSNTAALANGDPTVWHINVAAASVLVAQALVIELERGATP